MGTTSSVPAVIDGLLAGMRTAGLAAFEQWPGPEAAKEMIVLGQVTWEDYVIATIKAGRKHRQEDWAVAFELYVAGADGTTPADPSTARNRAFTLLGEVEDLLAEDVTAGTDFTTVQWVEVRLTDAEPRVFEKGWAYRVTGSFRARARLQ